MREATLAGAPAGGALPGPAALQHTTQRARTCSMPNHGSSLAAFSIATAHAWRVLVGSGFMSTCLPSGGSRGGSYVAHITCIWSFIKSAGSHSLTRSP